MSCRSHYRLQIITDIKSILKEEVPSSIEQDNDVIIRYNNSKKIGSKDQALQVARRIAKIANDKYLSQDYGASVFIDSKQEDGIHLQIRIPSLLLDAYEVKYGKQEVLFQLDEKNVDFQLKVSEALKSDKVRNPKSNLQGFYNDLQKQGVPNQQIDIIKSLNPEGKTKDELLTDLLANYSFAIEVNTAKEALEPWKLDEGRTLFTVDGVQYKSKDNNYYKFDENGEIVKIGEEEFKKAANKWLGGEERGNSSYYSNLTVAGGTNYTENEIATPLITPSIKGHAQFATDKGIGWFRSDEQHQKVNYSFEEWKTKNKEWFKNQGISSESDLKRLYQEEQNSKDFVSGNVVNEIKGSKTRRILEVQSDLFQKGRDKEDLINKTDKNKLIGFLKNEEKYLQQLNNELEEIKRLGENDLIEGKLADIRQQENIVRINKQNIDNFERFKKLPDNQFLQLLNKDNNWVTFFVKSIIQDSAKQTITEVQESDVETKVRELEREGLLEIDCKGKLKAEKGLQTNFTKGGKWKLIKDLKGYPTHKEGGVDLTIGKNGVSIKNGNTEFTAKHGLVIPKN